MSFLKRMEVHPQVVTYLLYSKEKELIVLVNKFRTTSSHACNPYAVVRPEIALEAFQPNGQLSSVGGGGVGGEER